jgi:hypothetical protein
MQKGRETPARLAKNRVANLDPLITTCELAAYRVLRQELTAKKMRKPGG